MSQVCAWGLFNENDQKSLDNGFLICGILSVALGSWLNWILLKSNLSWDVSYVNFANYTKTAVFRRAMALMPFTIILEKSNPLYCDASSFMDTFLAVLEIEWLTHVCIERYVLAKYITNGWQMEHGQYMLFKNLCICFASLYSFLPIFGVGQYAPDFSCNYCTMDMILPETVMRYSIVVMFFLRSVKPTAFMIWMLVRARQLENKLPSTKKNNKCRDFTWSIIVVTVVNLICWTPIALIRGYMLLSQLIYAQPILITSVYYIKWAMWLHWVAPTITAVALFCVDKKIRKNCFSIEYDYEKDE